MHYDPIKDRLASLIALFPVFRITLYRILDVLLLRQRYVKKMIYRYCKSPMNFYDAGSGFCQYSWFVLKNMPVSKVYATDVKKNYLDDFDFWVKETFADRFTYSVADIQFHTPCKQFDMIIAVDIMEHIEDDVRTFKNFHNCLKDEGILIISTPSDLDNSAQFTEEHFRPGYNKIELEQKLTNLGFDILDSIFTYGKFGSLSWKLMMKFPLQLLNRNIGFIAILPLWYLCVTPISEVLMHLDMKRANETGTGLLIVARKSQ